jgi:DNA-binding transcriptional LysR family regulator
MDAVESMKVFVRVAQLGGFSKASRELRMSPPAVTKHVAALESRLGSRLLDRTTRSVALTEAGRVYLERCLECLQSFDDAETSISELARKPRGLLRVTAPIEFRAVLTPVIAKVMNAHPDLAIDLRVSNRTIDLVEEGIDVAVRVAASLDGRFVARPLARVSFPFFAAPSYLEKHGRPRKPGDLARARNLIFVEPRPMTDIVFERNGRRVSVHIESVMISNSGEALRDAAVAGLGIAPIPSFLIRDAVSSGALEPVLPDWKLVLDARVYAIYPHRRFLSPKVKVFVEYLREAYGDGTRDPWWQG